MTIYLFKYLLFEIVYRLLVAVRFLHHPTGPLSCCDSKALSTQSYSTAQILLKVQPFSSFPCSMCDNALVKRAVMCCGFALLHRLRRFLKRVLFPDEEELKLSGEINSTCLVAIIEDPDRNEKTEKQTFVLSVRISHGVYHEISDLASLLLI